MNVESRITRLEEFRANLLEWEETADAKRRVALRSLLNQNLQAVRKDVVDAGCYSTVTIGEPPVTGGRVFQGQDPFALLFDAPFGMSFVDGDCSIIDRAS